MEHFALVSGDFDVLVLVARRTTWCCARWCWRSIQGIPGVRSTRTWLVFDEVRGAAPPGRTEDLRGHTSASAA